MQGKACIIVCIPETADSILGRLLKKYGVAGIFQSSCQKPVVEAKALPVTYLLRRP
jgi:hypothetical protein